MLVARLGPPTAPARKREQLLEITRITERFGSLTVLRDVSLDLGQAEIVASSRNRRYRVD